MVEIRKIAEILEGVIVGNEFLEIEGISTLEWAKDSDIAFAFKKKEFNKIEKSNAKVIIAHPFFVIDSSKTYIFTEKKLDEILLLVSNILQKKIKIGIGESNFENYEIHKRAFLETGVQVGHGTIIGPGTNIESGVIIGKNCKINSNVSIKEGTVIGENVILDSGVCLGAESFFRIIENGKTVLLTGMKGVEIQNGTFIGANSTIEKGIFRRTTVGENSVIGSLTTIGHDTIVGTNCKMVSQSGIAGKTTIGNNVTIFAQVGIADDVVIEDDVTIFAKSGVKGYIKSGETISGIPACNHKENMKAIIKLRRDLKCQNKSKI
ncbi:MAG: hypothetical protein ACRC0R_01590 [Cetobacterium sp.]